jgi:hypothetical protein
MHEINIKQLAVITEFLLELEERFPDNPSYVLMVEFHPETVKLINKAFEDVYNLMFIPIPHPLFPVAHVIFHKKKTELHVSENGVLQ